MANQGLQLTFGVEFECVLGFHESLLLKHLNAIGTDDTIVKDIPPTVRKDFAQAARLTYTGRNYMGWGLKAPTNYPKEGENNYQDEFDRQRSEHGYRAYGGEVLHVAKALLPEGVRIHDTFGPGIYNDFQHWHVCVDTTVTGVEKETLASKLGERSSNVNDWDSHGVELVTRVLPYEPASSHEIDQHLALLKGTETSKHVAFPTLYCGLHVHVGLPTPPDHPKDTPLPTFDLTTLKHLAYLTIIFERFISTLHPKSRRRDNSDIITNTDSFEQEPIDPFADWNWEENGIPPGFYDQNPEEDDNNDHLDFTYVRSKIFTPDMTLDKLVVLMCPLNQDRPSDQRRRIINWTYLTRPFPLARTLEFRQHEGSIDPVGVNHWVDFVVGLVQLAERMGREFGVGEFNEEGEWVGHRGQGYPWIEWSDEMCIGDLFDMMGWYGEGREYFLRRASYFAAGMEVG